jgi:hypothetical protein
MSIKEKRTFEEEKKNGMNVVTNMNGEKKANEKLEVADVSEKMTIPQVREYIRLYKTGGDVNKYLRQFKLLKPELDELQKLAARRTS